MPLKSFPTFRDLGFRVKDLPEGVDTKAREFRICGGFWFRGFEL